MTADKHRLNATPRRLLAVVVLAWLNLLVQPCLAELPAAAAGGMEHCDHDGGPHHGMPCPEMQAIDCEAPADLIAAVPQGDGAARVGSLLAILPAVSATAAPAAASADPGGGATPLHIRYCNLRN